MRPWQEAALYLLAALAYIGACILHPHLLFNWLPALGFLLAIVWVLPAALRRLL